jgi:hypothetical protein
MTRQRWLALFGDGQTTIQIAGIGTLREAGDLLEERGINQTAALSALEVAP